MKSNIQIHFVFNDGIVKPCSSVKEAHEFLLGHYSHCLTVQEHGQTVEPDDFILTVLSSGLSADDETFINRQVSFNQEIQMGVCDDKIIN